MRKGVSSQLLASNVLMSSARKTSVRSAAIPAEELSEPFPKLNLPIRPPYPPAEAKAVKELPRGSGWLYEPKWDGFRCLAFRQGGTIVLQSKAGQPLTRYFPEIVTALGALPAKFVLDGEIVIRSGAGLDFDALLQRIHPAASRVQPVAGNTGDLHGLRSPGGRAGQTARREPAFRPAHGSTGIRVGQHQTRPW
jgi:ATP-dependent DNA ligase